MEFYPYLEDEDDIEDNDVDDFENCGVVSPACHI